MVPGERMGWLMKLIGRNKCNFLPFIFGPFQEGDNSATRLREIYFLLSVSGLFCRVSEPLPHGAGVFGKSRSIHLGAASIFLILNSHIRYHCINFIIRNLTGTFFLEINRNYRLYPRIKS